MFNPTINPINQSSPNMSLTKICITFVLFLLFLFPISSKATIITVKQDGTGDYTSVQQAYLAAASGDTVLVYPGRYFENLTIDQISTDITIGSLYLTTQDRSYIRNTILDGNFQNSTVIMRNVENENILLCGFTIEHGIGWQGISDCGGGIYLDHANPVIESCVIQHNTAYAGGGISTFSSDVYLSDVVVRYNQGYVNAGGILCGYDSNTYFDSTNRCNVYLNYSARGSDYAKSSYAGAQQLYFDTCTVLNPDGHFLYSYDIQNYPVDDLDIDINHGKINPVDADLYINPIEGSDANDGLSPGTALKTISYALHLIQPDTINPNTIYLSNGVYGPHTNGEKFPLNGRTHVSIIGEQMDSTLFDADSNYYFFKAYGYMNNFCIKNISFVNGNGLMHNNTYSGIYLIACNNVTLDSLSIFNGIGNRTLGVFAKFCDSLLISNSKFINNNGRKNVSISNSDEPPKTFKINNCRLSNSGPLDDPDSYGCIAMTIGGGIVDNIHSGSLINVKITDNTLSPDPDFGGGSAVALGAIYKTNIDLVNVTIGNNKNMGYQGFAVNFSEGAEVDFYNCIMYGDSTNELGLGDHLSPQTMPVTASIAYTNIEGGKEGIINFYNQHTLNWYDGNMDADPLWKTAEDSAYHLPWNSPCVNTGVPMYEAGMDLPYIKEEGQRYVLYKYDGDSIHLPQYDLAGNPRISGGRIDMGAYEYQDIIPKIPEVKSMNSKAFAYPNPFKEETRLHLQFDKPGSVKIIISDIKGKSIKTLLDSYMSKGEYQLSWNGTNDYGNITPDGVYLVSIIFDGTLIESLKVIKK